MVEVIDILISISISAHIMLFLGGVQRRERKLHRHLVNMGTMSCADVVAGLSLIRMQTGFADHVVL